MGNFIRSSLRAAPRRLRRRPPRAFLGRFARGAILDEVQRAPELFSYLQTRVDERRTVGQFVLTGSQQFGLMASITQSLAGRVGLLHLLPLALAELKAQGKLDAALSRVLFRGLYPALFSRRVAPSQWYASYVATYVERDVRQVPAISDLAAFRRFLRMCAARCSSRCWCRNGSSTATTGRCRRMRSSGAITSATKSISCSTTAAACSRSK